MPWPEKQRVAIFLDTQRRKGTAAAKSLMHEAGYGGDSGTSPVKRSVGPSKAHGRLKRKRAR